MKPDDVSLEDKYTLASGRVYLTGTQALVRLPLVQRQRDVAAGLNTGTYISGYRGSPLGGYDQALARARKHLDAHHVRFQPGVNEDLAATAVWGTQQLALGPGSNYDGVVGIWYGKGPGVDRCGDVFRHANAAGTAPHGGVLCLAGDDHGAKSSTQAAQSDYIFMAVGIPVLAPCSVQEILDMGLHGIAMSRHAGCWVALKCVTDIVEGAASVSVDPQRVISHLPQDVPLPEGGLAIRWPEYNTFLDQEQRAFERKLFAAQAYARANGIDQAVWPAPGARLGIVATGKGYNDARQALDELGITEREAAQLGLRLYKVGMPWPLEPTGIADFAAGLDEILVIEEKRQLVEYQLKEQLYHLPDGQRPRVTGKFSGNGEWQVPQGERLLPSTGELNPGQVARVIARRLLALPSLSPEGRARIESALAWLAAKDAAMKAPGAIVPIGRVPYFCSGCPHNTSTHVPEGSRALAGIGCHYMVQWMPDRRTATFSHMGGEGAAWCGQFPFTSEKHVFANLGDGTYFHSGLLAIRAAVAAKAPITYKLLFNDAVAMTGGQHHDGPLDPAMITRQVAAEGVTRIVVVTDEPEKYKAVEGLAPGTTVHHRDELDAVQRSLRDWSEAGGTVSLLVYDQTCAAEKRRRRKRGTFPDPARRAVINEAVCEGCGDCGEASNCVSVEPLETEFGRKRTINQSSCNKDFSCVNGFCPSFVTVEGGELRRGAAVGRKAEVPELPEPALPSAAAPYGVLVTGIGGTGVVTIGQILGMASHLEGKGVTVLDMTGLAQKNGAVISFVRIADQPSQLHAPRIASGGAHAVIGCDLVVSAGAEALGKMREGLTRAAINSARVPTADFTHKPDWTFPEDRLHAALARATGPEGTSFIDATRIATALMGNAIAANMFLLGYAWQKGLLPLAEQSIQRAIELNEVSVDSNKAAFAWGRYAAHDLAAVEKLVAPDAGARAREQHSATLQQLVDKRVALLTAYQDAAYAKRYAALVERVRGAESARCGAVAMDAALDGSTLTEAVARYYAKLLAYKDEYEVARLYTDGGFEAKVAAMFEGDVSLKFHLAPPVFNRPDPVTGVARKSQFGPWMMGAFRLLAKLRFLRGGPLDIFGRTEERRMERQLVADYERNVGLLLGSLTPANRALAVQLASLPEQVRGFGHVKLKHLRQVREREAALHAQWQSPAAASLTKAA